MMNDVDLLLDDLSTEQLSAVTAPLGPLAIYAGAGSGKTRVLTRRIAYRIREQSALSRHVVAVTFTRKAAEELRSRLSELIHANDIVAGTFHAIAYAQLQRWYTDRDKQPPALVTSRRSFINRNLSSFSSRIETDVALPAIDWGRARGLPAEEFHAQIILRKSSLLPQEIPIVAELYQAYELEKRKRFVLDFEDLLLRTAELMQTDAEFGDVQRWRFRHFFVDEVQDINPSQVALLDAWLGPRDDLCVVGDPHQAIYGWNGADSTFLKGFSDRYRNAKVITLRDNFRSTPNILSMAHAALEVADNLHLAIRQKGNEPTLTAYANDRDEVTSVIAGVEEARNSGLLFTDIAILARTNSLLDSFARTLQQKGIPVRISTSVRDTQQNIRKTVGEWKRTTPDLPPAQSLTRWIDSHGPGADGIPHLREIDELIAEFIAIDPGGTTKAFYDWLSVATTAEHSNEPGIDLLTFHRAKGLEWHTVFVVGLESGYVPINSGDIDEERRLLYVALTRATDILHCSYAKKRTFGSRESVREPSPFLVRVSARPKATAEVETWKDALASARAKLRTQ